MHRCLPINAVRRALTGASAGLIVALTLAMALPGHAQASPTELTTATCPGFCVLVYMPVTCIMSDRSVRTFTNRCFADRYAACNGLTVINCRPAWS